ncbi:hypothetical protein OIY81_3084 [Cryptosporidium canis]|uniref:LisH domain-containing protein n=1 Tax=Cryptosporidium canis TaxID=195482 RepID=A0ABQ8P554_9CRYT|nr:hypothetical protein OIY81_3084 [Cryptosporidium canis]KAJ1607691.1 hypothetical protein OJ252_2781 [Cryptosporidium canis]
MQEDSSLEELRSAVKSELEKKGVLDEVRARLMAEILYSLTEENNENEQAERAISDENLVLNSLIYDYLVYNGYQNTGMVLLKESKMDSGLREGDKEHSNASQLLSKEELKSILRVEDSSGLPILYSLIK